MSKKNVNKVQDLSLGAVSSNLAVPTKDKSLPASNRSPKNSQRKSLKDHVSNS